MSEELNNKPQEQNPEVVEDPTMGVEPTIQVNDEGAIEPEVKVEEVHVEEPQQEPQEEKPVEEEKEEVKEEKPQEPTEPEQEKPVEEEKDETPEEQPEQEKPTPEEPVENIEDIKRELEELKAVQKEEKQIQEFSAKRDQAVAGYNDMCARLADALAGEFEKYGIDASKTLDEIAKEDPSKAEIAKGLITQAQRIQDEQKAKVNNELNNAFTDIVFERASRLMNKFGLTPEQEVVVAETFINIMENSGIKDLVEDLQAKVELAVAKAKMVVPTVAKAVVETKEAVEAVKEVVETIKQEPQPIVEEPPKPVVEPVAVEDFTEGVVQGKDSTPAAALDETNVLQKLASLPHKERVAFYKENFELINRASLIAAREHEQRLRNGEVI